MTAPACYCGGCSRLGCPCYCHEAPATPPVRVHSARYVGARELTDGAYECGYCGALILDRYAHRDWHREVDPPRRPEAVPDAT